MHYEKGQPITVPDFQGRRLRKVVWEDRIINALGGFLDKLGTIGFWWASTRLSKAAQAKKRKRRKS